MDIDAIDELIRTTRDARIVKRALVIKMLHNGLSGQQISHLLNVSEQYVSKWKGIYEDKGASGLNLGYKGRPAYLTAEERQEIVTWIRAQKTILIEDLVEYVEAQYSVIYQSKQSYYDLLDEGGMSYHKAELTNPKRNEAQIEEKREEIKKNWRKTTRQSSEKR
jgi:putative transposase